MFICVCEVICPVHHSDLRESMVNRYLASCQKLMLILCFVLCLLFASPSCPYCLLINKLLISWLTSCHIQYAALLQSWQKHIFSVFIFFLPDLLWQFDVGIYKRLIFAPFFRGRLGCWRGGFYVSYSANSLCSYFFRFSCTYMKEFCIKTCHNVLFEWLKKSECPQ